MTETVNIPVTLYKTENGKPTCALKWPDGKVCPFVMSQKFGMDLRCFFDPDGSLQRDDRGWGYLIPSEKCPLVEVEK